MNYLCNRSNIVDSNNTLKQMTLDEEVDLKKIYTHYNKKTEEEKERKNNSDSITNKQIKQNNNSDIEDLEKLLEESVKSNHIEGLLIKYLKQKNNETIFDDEFLKIFNVNSLTREIINFQYYPDISYSRSPSKQKTLAKNFIPFIDRILTEINNKDKNIQSNALLTIRNIFDYSVINNDNKMFFGQINQIFFHSKTLLNFIVSPYLINAFTNYLIDGTSNFSYGKEGNDYVCKINFNNKIIKSVMTTKAEGLHFGSILNIQNENSRFFIKSFHGYPAKNKGSRDATFYTTNYICSLSKQKNIEQDINLKPSVLNLKEPFLYSVFDKINIGPRSYFIINPYITNGFFIATNDLSNNEENFVLNKDWNLEKLNVFQKEQIGEFLSNKYNSGDSLNDLLSLREMAFITNIFQVADIKDDNIGFVLPKKYNNDEYNENEDTDLEDFFIENFETKSKSRKWKILDFLIHDRKDYDSVKRFKDNCFFTKGVATNQNNTIGKLLYSTKISYTKRDLLKENVKKYVASNFKLYVKAIDQFENRLLDYAKNNDLLIEIKNQDNIQKLKQEIKDKIKYKNEKDNENDLILRYLLQSQADTIKNLMLTQRGDNENEEIFRHPTEEIEVNGIKRLRNRTNAELIGFDNGIAPENLEEKEKLKYLNNAFKDLDLYTEDIVENYKIMKEFINEGYDKYFGTNNTEGKINSDNSSVVSDM